MEYIIDSYKNNIQLAFDIFIHAVNNLKGDDIIYPITGECFPEFDRERVYKIHILSGKSYYSLVDRNGFVILYSGMTFIEQLKTADYLAFARDYKIMFLMN